MSHTTHNPKRTDTTDRRREHHHKYDSTQHLSINYVSHIQVDARTTGASRVKLRSSPNNAHASLAVCLEKIALFCVCSNRRQRPFLRICVWNGTCLAFVIYLKECMCLSVCSAGVCSIKSLPSSSAVTKNTVSGAQKRTNRTRACGPTLCPDATDSVRQQTHIHTHIYG